MAYTLFPQDFINRVIDACDLVQLVGESVKLKRAGAAHKGICPFHDDTNPSMRVDAKRYKCWACGAEGNCVDWMRNYHHLSFVDSIRRLAHASAIPLPADEAVPADPDAKRRFAAMYSALEGALRCYTYGLKNSPRARDYLAERGLTDATIEKFELGVVRKGIRRLLDRVTDADLEVVGLLARSDDNRAYERFRHRVMFPIRNERGSLIGFGGRTFWTRADDAPKYLNSPETPLFQKGRELYAMNHAVKAIRTARSAVIVEGYLDVLSLHQAGECRAVAPMGTAMTDAQVRKLFMHADEIIFAFDGDTAGRRAALRSAAVVLNEMVDGKRARFVFLPEGTDPDSFVREQGIDAWREAIAKGLPLSNLLLDYIQSGLNLATPEHLVVAHERAVRILTRDWRAPVFRAALGKSFEQALGMPINIKKAQDGGQP